MTGEGGADGLLVRARSLAHRATRLADREPAGAGAVAALALCAQAVLTLIERRLRSEVAT